MLKTFATATAVCALMLSGAMAQTTQPAPTTPPAATQQQPGSPGTTQIPEKMDKKPVQPGSSAAAASAPQFISAQKSDQWLASKFSGTDVLGPSNEKIGDVNDMLFDKSGKVVGLVVGVGGFLGIGQKDVAIDMAAFEMVPASTTDNTGAGTGARTAATTDPNDIKLKVSWTKEQLKEAPSFERYKAPSAARTSPTTGTRPTGGGSPTR